jgi:hypothetical protein
MTEREAARRAAQSARDRARNESDPPRTRAYTIQEFCEAYRVSRGMLYKMWRNGAGPRFFRAGSKVLISDEAADAWRVACESAASAAA